MQDFSTSLGNPARAAGFPLLPPPRRRRATLKERQKPFLPALPAHLIPTTRQVLLSSTVVLVG